MEIAVLTMLLDCHRIMEKKYLLFDYKKLIVDAIEKN
jgi:hypothetical protein